jgi:hypothetical protein
VNSGPDIARMRRDLSAIRNHPENSDLTTWVENFDVGTISLDADREDPGCGTTLCLAGWDTFLHAPAGSVIDVLSTAVMLPGGSRSRIREYARDGMRISDEQAEALFVATTDPADIKAMIDALEENPTADFEDLVNARDYARDLNDPD